MRKGILITRGAIIESSPETRWSLAVPVETSVLEIVALMAAFGLYCELEEGGQELRLLPIDHRPPPTADRLAAFYQAGNFPADRRARFRSAAHAGA